MNRNQYPNQFAIYVDGELTAFNRFSLTFMEMIRFYRGSVVAQKEYIIT